jgi:hypothetical protein
MYSLVNTICYFEDFCTSEQYMLFVLTLLKTLFLKYIFILNRKTLFNDSLATFIFCFILLFHSFVMGLIKMKMGDYK